MATQQETADALSALSSKLNDISAEVDKVGTETDGLVKSVADLTAQIAAGGSTTPEVDAALQAVQAGVDRLAAQVKTVDDKVADATPPG